MRTAELAFWPFAIPRKPSRVSTASCGSHTDEKTSVHRPVKKNFNLAEMFQSPQLRRFGRICSALMLAGVGRLMALAQWSDPNGVEWRTGELEHDCQFERWLRSQ